MIKNSKITSREIQVLALIIQAKNRKRIAQELKISINTLDKHLHHIHIKTNTSTNSELILWIIMNKSELNINETEPKII